MPGVSPSQQFVHLARQPILDVHGHVFGYELLYRAEQFHTECVAAGEIASARVLNDALLNVGLHTVTGGKVAFVNMAPQVLLSDAASLLPPDGIVIELLETMAVTDDVVAMCRSLQLRGYALALDDFVPGSDAEALLPYAKFVKLDALALGLGELDTTAARLLPRGLRLLAEKVETASVRDAARAAGYTLFQGHFFCRPQTLSARALETSQLTQMRLLAALNRPGATLVDLEDLIKHDGTLSLRVLRCVNSAAVGNRSEVRSIREALLLLGLDQIRKWVSIWTLASLNGGAPEVVTMAVIRAKACELLAGTMKRLDNAGYFLLGLCSLLDVILSCPMAKALEVMPLDADTRAALMGERNQAREVLDAVIHYERGEWSRADRGLSAAALSIDELGDAYAEALAWADELTAVAA